jgi:hypothetical protein
VAGGAAEANAAVTGSLVVVPQRRASRATDWLASGSLEAGAARHQGVELAHRGLLERLAHPDVEHLEEARLEPEDRGGAYLDVVVAAVRRGHGGRDVDLGVEGVGQQQRDDTTSSNLARASLSTTVFRDGLDRSRNAVSILRSGRSTQTSSTSALMVAADRGSRLP